MSVNVESQVAEDSVEDFDDLENIEGENNAPHQSRQHKKGSEEKIEEEKKSQFVGCWTIHNYHRDWHLCWDPFGEY